MIDESMRARYAEVGVSSTRDALATDLRSYHRDIGDYTYGKPDVLWWGERASLTIGRYCSIAQGVSIALGGNHRADWVTTFPFSVLDPAAAHIEGHPSTNGDVRIGNDVWLGDECRILSGVTIGDGACVGTRALITRDVPAYAIVGGVPAAVLRMRFRDDQIAALLRIRWWDWPIERLRALYGPLLSSDVDGFIAAAEADGRRAQHLSTGSDDTTQS